MDTAQLAVEIEKFFETHRWFAGNTRVRNAIRFSEHLAAVLPPTFDEVIVAGMKVLETAYIDMIIGPTGSGAIKSVPSRGVQISWPATKTLGKTILAVIEAAMRPEPTGKEKALEVCDQIIESLSLVGPVGDIYKGIEIIRKALEAE